MVVKMVVIRASLNVVMSLEDLYSARNILNEGKA
jgi:hypothetical protein